MAVWGGDEEVKKEISPYEKFGTSYSVAAGSGTSSSYQKKLQLPQSRWETFQRIRQNRHQRLSGKLWWWWGCLALVVSFQYSILFLVRTWPNPCIYFSPLSHSFYAFHPSKVRDGIWVDCRRCSRFSAQSARGSECVTSSATAATGTGSSGSTPTWRSRVGSAWPAALSPPFPFLLLHLFLLCDHHSPISLDDGHLNHFAASS